MITGYLVSILVEFHCYGNSQLGKFRGEVSMLQNNIMYINEVFEDSGLS